MVDLTPRQQKFVAALTTPHTPAYCRPSEAYRAISPTIKPPSVWNGASRMVRDAQVQQAIRGQLSVAQMGRELKRCLRVTKSVQHTATDPSVKLSATRETRETIMDYAKLTGQLVEKREVTTDGGVALLVQRLLCEAADQGALPVAADAHLPALLSAERGAMPSTPSVSTDAERDPSRGPERGEAPPDPTAG
jgi:hypothetical protein